MALGMEVGLSPGDFVLDGDPAPRKRGTAPLFDHVYCAKTAGWIKMPLGTEVGLGRGPRSDFFTPAVPVTLC